MTFLPRRETLFRVPFLIRLFISIGVSLRLQAQDSAFVQRSNIHLSLGQRPFYATGVNSYFLQNLAAYGDTTHLDEIFQTAQTLGITTIRTWGFFDSPDSTIPAVIQYAPGKYNEAGLRALDYAVAAARAHSLRLIVPLVNNWDDYGGMNQYVQWYADEFPSLTKRAPVSNQRVVFGTAGRKYNFRVSGSLTHDDFYTQPTIRQWYKDYLRTLLNRINTVTQIPYKNEPTILAWELANEPRSSDPSGGIVYNWLAEMSRYVKSIDANHLVSSGEEGLDISPVGYSPADSYNGQAWLFSGDGGISYSQNLTIPTLDVVSIHCYPEPWGLTVSEGIVWLRDHQRLADASQKPLIIGEIGTRAQPGLFYEVAFNEAYFSNSAGMLLWQLTFENSPYDDDYAFSCPASAGVCSILEKYASRFEQKRNGTSAIPAATFLLRNYPNPFNLTTVISYDLSARSQVLLEVFNSIGQKIGSPVDEIQDPGSHSMLFDASTHGGGSYFIRLTANGISHTQKVLLIK